MKKQITFLFLILFPSLAFSQETQKRILFTGDSIWYAGENQMLFSTTDKGKSWDTIFAKNSLDTVFIIGILDTATNVFISDQRTLFVFCWDGTMHRKTILFCSSDGGKSWNKTMVYAQYGVVGVKYIHKVSSTHFILDCRQGYYAFTEDAGKTWKSKCIMHGKYSCPDERLTYHPNGDITFSFSLGQQCKHKEMMLSQDYGKSWVKTSNKLYTH